jgi:hypothetical protein
MITICIECGKHTDDLVYGLCMNCYKLGLKENKKMKCACGYISKNLIDMMIHFEQYHFEQVKNYHKF